MIVKSVSERECLTNGSFIVKCTKKNNVRESNTGVLVKVDSLPDVTIKLGPPDGRSKRWVSVILELFQ